jgi:hypothetical protein
VSQAGGNLRPFADSLFSLGRDVNLLPPSSSSQAFRPGKFTGCITACPQIPPGCRLMILKWHERPVWRPVWPSPTRNICTLFLREPVLPRVELYLLGPEYPAHIPYVYIRNIIAYNLILTRAGRISIAVANFEHYSNRVVCPFGVIRSWLSGKTLDQDFTFTSDEIMT